jgi:hypothetical protein
MRFASRLSHAGAVWLVALAAVGLLASAQALAQDFQPEIYAGAGVGTANSNQSFATPFEGVTVEDLAKNRLGWKLLAGIRVLSFVGAELEYMDFGTAHVGPQSQPGNAPTDQFYGGEGSARAGALSAVGYVPLPIPWFDLFGKVGIGYLRASTSYSGDFPNTYYVDGTAVGRVSVSETDSDEALAYGGGVQVHLGDVAVRLEYEGLRSGIAGDPGLLSIGLTWKF